MEKNQNAQLAPTGVQNEATGLAQYLEKDNVKGRLDEVFGENASAIKSTLLSVCTLNPLLRKCTPWSIVRAAALIASSKLSLLPSMGQAYIVPYKNREGSYEAQFQLGFKGMIQLAYRTGQYTRLHAGKVFEGEFRGMNPLTGEPILGGRVSDKIVGYVAYMQLTSGFEKTVYMTTDEIEAHARQYSQSYIFDKKNNRQTSPWTTSFETMATKTVLKKLLNTWGVLSTELARVIKADQSVVGKDTFTYLDELRDEELGTRNLELGTRDEEEPVPSPQSLPPTVDMRTGELLDA